MAEQQKVTHPKFIGLSSDQRTNRWRVTCPCCGHEFIPRTTRLYWQTLDCPKAKCNARLMADYNAEPPTVKALLTGEERGKKEH